MEIPGICGLGGQLVARVPGEELEKVFYEATKLCPSGCSQQCSVRIGGAQLGERAYRDDRSVALKHRAVVDLLTAMAIQRPCDHMLAANDRRRHRLPLCPDEMSNPLRYFPPTERANAYVLEFCR